MRKNKNKKPKFYHKLFQKDKKRRKKGPVLNETFFLAPSKGLEPLIPAWEASVLTARLTGQNSNAFQV